MMKSFFKKLAFVMALAMVVSSMAPAATAKAADNQLDICLQDEAYTAVRTTYEMTEGDAPVDFKFAGAPTEWRTLGLKWDSSDKTVAEVSQAGVVTAKAVGTTKITIASADGAWVGEMALTVKEKVEVPAYEVKQTAGDKLTITWADAKNATDKVEVYKVYKLTDGDRNVKWPSETKVDKGVATVTVNYGGLEDGCDYVVKFGNVEKTITARVGKIVDIEVVPVAYGKDNKKVDGLYVSENDEYRIAFEVTYITDNDIRLTTAPEGTYMNYELLDGGDDIYLDSTGYASYIYEKDAWAYVDATYCYTENEVDKTIPKSVFIAGVEKEEAKLAGITKYTLAGVKDDVPSTLKKDVVWSDTSIIVDDRACIALEIADTLGATYYTGLDELNDSETKFYNGEFGTISYLSSNDEVVLVGANGLVTPVSTGEAAVIVVLTTKNDDGQDVPKNIYAFDILVDKSRAVDKVTANDVTVLTDSKYIDSKANVEIKAVDNYKEAWKGFTATVETTSDVPTDVKKFTVKDTDNDGKVTLPIDGSKYGNVNSVTYKVTVGNKTATFRVNLKKATYVSGYSVKADEGIAVNGKVTGSIDAKIEVYTFWRNNGVEYKLENVTDTVILTDGASDFWNKNPENLKDKLVVTVTTPDAYKGSVNVTGSASSAAIVIPGVANVPTDDSEFTVISGDYKVTVDVVKNVSQIAGADTEAKGDDLFKVTRKSTEKNLTVAIENTALKFTNPVFAKLDEGEVYGGNSIEQVILENVTYSVGDKKEIAALKVVDVDCIENADAGKIYVKSAKVWVPVYFEGKEVGCYFEQTVTLNKLLPCADSVFAPVDAE